MNVLQDLVLDLSNFEPTTCLKTCAILLLLDYFLPMQYFLNDLIVLLRKAFTSLSRTCFKYFIDEILFKLIDKIKQQ